MPGILKRLLPIGFGSQRCPVCDALITSDVINIKEGVALCPGCGKLSRLSELNTSGRSIAEILAQPPAGCSIVSDGQRVTATVSLRSLAGFLFPAGFALFWNSITSVFVLIDVVGPLPNWFPAPGLKDGKPEMNGGPMDLGMTLFLCVFLIPFVTVGIGMAGAAIMNLIGKVEVVIDEFDSYVATGFAFLRWKKRFDPREVQAVEFGSTPWQSDGGSNRLIEIKANRSVKFGSMLHSDRMEWLRAVLWQTLLPQNDDNQASTHPRLAWLSRKPP
jgi:hypothetical protein